MPAAALRIELYLRDCRSRDAKRSLLRPVVDGLRKRHRASAAEVAQLRSPGLTTIGVAVVAPSQTQLSELLDDAERFVESFAAIEVLRVSYHDLDADET